MFYSHESKNLLLEVLIIVLTPVSSPDESPIWRGHGLVSPSQHLSLPYMSNDTRVSTLLNKIVFLKLIFYRLVATLGAKSNTKKVTRKAILDVDVQKACETIMEPDAPMALRLQSNLL